MASLVIELPGQVLPVSTKIPHLRQSPVVLLLSVFWRGPGKEAGAGGGVGWASSCADETCT